MHTLDIVEVTQPFQEGPHFHARLDGSPVNRALYVPTLFSLKSPSLFYLLGLWNYLSSLRNIWLRDEKIILKLIFFTLMKRCLGHNVLKWMHMQICLFHVPQQPCICLFKSANLAQRGGKKQSTATRTDWDFRAHISVLDKNGYFSIKFLKWLGNDKIIHFCIT